MRSRPGLGRSGSVPGSALVGRRGLGTAPSLPRLTAGRLLAGAAHSPATTVAAPPHVRPDQRMPVHAHQLGCLGGREGGATEGVDPWSYWLQVFRAATRRVTAQVIQLQPSRNRCDEFLPGNAVGVAAATAPVSEPAVPLRVPARCPHPAAGRLVHGDLAPEPLRQARVTPGRRRRDYRRRHAPRPSPRSAPARSESARTPARTPESPARHRAAPATRGSAPGCHGCP